ncbi:hypothetical protein K488DRAFT_49424 [Vararia minispora EC-137]|uniref:Uncharacterized protein n=1 Tax=Vararia minispora EC-137 TaxID=1314806 RepID=A0ACB8QLE7_9AGAM|nr:hypothetical protein K488DRAFT_49424 [Vararia minispora EC-137]
MFYYAGISPTPPRLVYRTGSDARPFIMPKGLEAYRRLKETRGVFNHPLNLVWATKAGPKVRDLLTAERVAWTSIDGIRFLTHEDDGTTTLGPVVVWVGVCPGSLTGDDAFIAAGKILDVLSGFDVHDVEVEFRESLYHRSVGPALLKSVSNVNHIVDVCDPLTTALGLPIATAERPDAQGTVAVYFAEGGESTKTLALTCHHVALKVDADHNEDYTLQGGGAPRKSVHLLGTRAFNRLLESIRLRIGRHGIMVEILERDIKRSKDKLEGDEELDEDDVAEAKKELTKAQGQLAEANEAIEALEKFYATVKKDWGSAKNRIIGHIRRSPPVAFNVQPGGFTSDWAVIELDGSRFKNYKGSFIGLETKIGRDDFTLKMYPRDDGRPSFKYPAGRLLPIRGMISEELMRAPDMLDHDNEPCLIVIKSGNATGVTIGRATGIESFVRDLDTGETSMEWAVYNYDNKSGVFSAPGDSGSLVVDGLGRMGGMLNGGSGKTESSDITYVTPMFQLWKWVKAEFPDAYLCPNTIV